MSPTVTVAAVVDRLAALGLVRDARTAETMRAEAGDTPVTEYYPAEYVADAVVGLAIDLGGGVEVHPDDVDDLVEGYESTFADIVRVTGGTMVIADLELTEGVPEWEEGNAEPRELLRFTVDGETVEWSPDHIGDEYLDGMVFVENIDELTPAGSRRWAIVSGPGGEHHGPRFLFGEPDALLALAEFGVDVHLHR